MDPLFSRQSGLFKVLVLKSCPAGLQDLTLAEVRTLRARQRLFARDQSYNDLFRVRHPALLSAHLILGGIQCRC